MTSTPPSTPEKENEEKFPYPDSVEVEDDSESKSDMIHRMTLSLIKRLKRELEENSLENSPDDFQTFLQLHHEEIKKDSKLVEILKQNLPIFIAQNGFSFMKEYSLICQDDSFDDYVIPRSRVFSKPEQPVLPPVSAEDLINVEKWVENNCKWNVLRKTATGELKVERKTPHKFKIGQIVGARDTERKWWMARILYIFEDPEYPYPWYYVHFEGWDSIHNEWIASPYRIKKFNPRRDFLKR